MKIKEVNSAIKEYNDRSELSENDNILIKIAVNACKKAYAPYSEFKVGAALSLENGEIIEGNNQENASYPAGMCAERVAIFYAGAKFPDIQAKTLAIVAMKDNKLTKEPITPCGSCRQALFEYESRFKEAIRIILAGEKKIWIVNKINDILPLVFDKSYLKE